MWWLVFAVLLVAEIVGIGYLVVRVFQKGRRFLHELERAAAEIGDRLGELDSGLDTPQLPRPPERLGVRP
ncbi:MAG: hypothetical protein Q4G45_01455 [Actinomycetia bacterium]|nr:hypothetical protein [Actinomycetes bacterium]